MISVIESLGLVPIGQAQTPQSDHPIFKFKNKNNLTHNQIKSILSNKKNTIPITEQVTKRNKVKINQKVKIQEKKDQRTNNYTIGKVKRILTNTPNHRQGIKVKLESGEVGRVIEILEGNQ